MESISRIISGKRYDTENAELLAEVSRGYRSDYNFEDTGLYRTAKGAFFLAGEGGATSRWGRKEGNDLEGGSGIKVLTPVEAREFLEDMGTSGAYLTIERLFADEIEDA